MKIRLIEGWRSLYLYWSARLQAVCAAIAAWFT